jgi:hypothetical protein
MHDRLTRIDEIMETLAGSPLAASGGAGYDEMAVDAALIDLLFEKMAALNIRKEACADKSFESRAYNELLMALAEARSGLRDFEDKYGAALLR